MQLREGASVFTVIHMINGDVDTTGEYQGNNDVRHKELSETSEETTRLYARIDGSEKYNTSVIRAEFREYSVFWFISAEDLCAENQLQSFKWKYPSKDVHGEICSLL